MVFWQTGCILLQRQHQQISTIYVRKQIEGKKQNTNKIKRNKKKMKKERKEKKRKNRKRK